MIKSDKSDKEMKNNVIHYSYLLKPLPNAAFENVFPGLAISLGKKMSSTVVDSQSKVKLQIM